MKYSYKIDTKLLPKVWVTWASTKNGEFNKRYWLNCQTGTKKEKPESWMHYENENDMVRHWNRPEGHCGLDWKTMKSKNIWVNSGSNVRYMYVKYHKGIDMLEIAAVGMDTTRAAEIKNWEYLGDRFFIDKDKNIFDQNGNTPSRYYVYEWHDAWNANVLFSTLMRLNYNDDAINEFKKFIGRDYFTIGNGRCVDIDSVWSMQLWYKTSQKPRGKGKEQQLTDMLTAIPLSDASDFAVKYPPKKLSDSDYYRDALRDVAYFERVSDEWSVIREFKRNDENTLTEVCRIYINDNGKTRIVSPSNKDWVPSTQRSHWSEYYNFVNKDEAIEKCNRIKYALESLPETEEYYLIDVLIRTLRFPEIEQLGKLGCSKIVKNIIYSSTPKADIKYNFGEYYNDKEKSILRRIGMTKPQLDVFNKLLDNGKYYDSKYIKGLKMMREAFGKDLSHLDIKSYERYLKGFTHIGDRFWSGIDSYARDIGFDVEKFIRNLIRLGEKREEIYGVVHDALNAYTRLNYGTAPEINWYFDDCSDAVRAHDAIIALKNEQDEERRAMWDMEAAERRKKEEEKRKKVDKERKQYEYEDDEYIIRLPKDSNEIVREGSMQHICIGGYTSRHATGDTNLFFLRKKSEPEFPFYAIEMNKFKNIVQIHGFGNKWLGNDPEAIPTVIRWLRKNGIQCDQKILTCKAKGYGSCNDYVPMPEVD